jgi:hypothetical protein
MNVGGREAKTRILAVAINVIVEKHKICNSIHMTWKDDNQRQETMYQMLQRCRLSQS